MPREISRWKRKLLWLIFFGSFGFAGGGAFLLFGLVPLERHFASSGWSQREIDQTLSLLVFGWFLFALLVASLYSRFTLLEPRPVLAISLAAGMAVTAGFVFQQFLHAKSLMLAGRSANVEEVSPNLSFGPYPDKEALQLLKDQGYDGVINLLHPAIPFEEVLAREEKKNGADVGIQVYAFPMLPWISENKAALAGIRELIQQPDQRYYVHCYLGQHRANLVRRMAGFGTSAEEAVDPQLPDHLERGLLFNYEGGRIVVGPLPTDEEWFGVILRHGVREVISTLDPENAGDQKLVAEMRKIGRDYGFTLTERPLDKDTPDAGAVRRLADSLKKSDRKVYVVGFQTDNWALALDKALGGHEVASTSFLAENRFQRGRLMKVNDAVVLGPYPTDAEVEVLKKAGVRAVVSLLADDQGELVDRESKWAEENHFVLKRFPLKPHEVSRAKLEDVAVYVFNQPGLTYVHSLHTDDTVRELYRTMRRMIRE